MFVHGPALDGEVYPEGCPFNTRRAGRVRELAESLGLLSPPDRIIVPPVPATRADLGRFHTPAYLDLLEQAERGELGFDGLKSGLGTMDCPLFARMYRYPALAVGGTLVAARALIDGRARVAFNPSGGFHHAMPDRAGGFCYLNDVVLGAMELVDAGLRVAVLDIDAHHSDGVQHAFWSRRDVLVISVHESGATLFPGTGFEDEIGEGEGRGYTLNVPLPAAATDPVFEAAMREVVWPVLDAYRPDVVVLEMGMDVLAGDPLTHLRMTNNAPADVVSRLVRSGRPVLAVGGGGYHFANTVRGWTLCWSILCGAGDGMDDYGGGVGGMMLQNTDWLGGLRDRPTVPDPEETATLMAELAPRLERIRREVFPIHGLG